MGHSLVPFLYINDTKLFLRISPTRGLEEHMGPGSLFPKSLDFIFNHLFFNFMGLRCQCCWKFKDTQS